MSVSVAKTIRTTASITEGFYSALAKAAESTHVSTAWPMRDELPVRLGERDKPAAELESDPGTFRQTGKKGKSA